MMRKTFNALLINVGMPEEIREELDKVIEAG
jgi:hypothetical protein